MPSRRPSPIELQICRPHFAEFFARLDLTILERSWGSVELTGVKMSFATCQRRLRGVLRGIDKLLVPKRRS